MFIRTCMASLSLVFTIPDILMAQETSFRAPNWNAAQKDYEEALKRDRNDVQRFRSASAENVDQVKLPVVLPVLEAQRSTGGFFHQINAYAAIFPFNGAQLTVTGTIGTINVDDDPTEDFSGMQELKEKYIFETSEGGADLSYEEYGSTYILRISCNDQNDSRCTKDTFLTEVADTMEPLGGEGLVQK